MGKSNKWITLWETLVLRKTCVLLFTMMSVGAIFANPIDGSVVSGNATITQTTGNTQINQTSDQAIINWKSFNIAPGEATHFQQPTNGVALNRIDPGQGVSQIYGSLTSTGKIILINQAGIYFGPNSLVNVGGLIASTSDMTNANFLAGHYIFDQTSPYRGTVINQGTIIAANNGLVALVGSNVSNEGYIQANSGHVILASGNKFTVDLAGDGLIHFAVDEASSSSGVDQNGQTMTDGVSNSGTIIANGGRITLSAKSAQGVVDNAINMSGVAQAQSVYQKNGEIIFSASPQGKIVVAGKVDVSGKRAGERGGTVKILAGNIHLKSLTYIDASGSAGGGLVLVGGNFHGAGPEPNTLTTLVDSGAAINANALLSGGGGQVAVWSDLYTGFHGSITAQGGLANGNGGYVETSGGYLNIAGAIVNTLAPQGTTGTWLLDPSDLTICTACSTTATIGTNAYNNNATNSNLLVTDLTTALASNNILVQTTNTGSGGNGDITVATPITWSSSNTLTLNAFNKIYLNADITATSGGLTLVAANTITQSITSGTVGSPSATGVTANINVNNFNLSAGQWYQINSTLPSFAVKGNFQIASGAINPTTAEFLRASGGSGTTGSPYQITDIYGLQGINSNDSGTGAHNLLTQNFQLMNNISASTVSGWTNANGTGFTPIGNLTTGFSGQFNGQNFTLSNLSINVTAANITGLGLFGVVKGTSAQNTIIQNLILQSTTITGNNAASTGSIIGHLLGNTFTSGISTTITNILTINPTISGSNNSTGGAIGGAFDSSTNDSPITISNIGVVNPTITSAGGYLGGFVGGTDDQNIRNNARNIQPITNSYVQGGTVSTTYASPNAFVGGFVGNSGTSFSNNYTTAAVSGPSTTIIGGFVGRAAYGVDTISNSYSTGAVSGSGGLGGFVAQISGGSFTNNFWDTTTSGLGSSAAGTGMSSANFLLLANFNSATAANGNVNPGWSITSTPTTGATTSPSGTWFIFNGSTRPMLLTEAFPTTSTNNAINTTHQLQLMGAALGESYTQGRNIDFASIITSDIWNSKFSATTSGAGFLPIGNGSAFTGSFNGAGFTISNLFINSSATNNVGLFSALTGASISNVGLITPNISSSGNQVGGGSGNPNRGYYHWILCIRRHC